MSESCGCAGEDPNPSTVPGGWSGEKPADANVQKIANQVRKQYEQKTGDKAKEFKVECFKSQIVSGTKYKMMVNTGDGQYSIITVYQPLSYENKGPELTDIKQNVNKCDKIY